MRRSSDPPVPSGESTRSTNAGAIVQALVGLACLGLLGADGCPPQTIQETKLLASDGAVEDSFGRSVSVSGNAAVVGALRDDDNGDQSGSAYVFRSDGTDWVEEAKLLASDGARDDYFGAVSISGDVAVVGASGDDDNGNNSGSVYVFRHDGTNWVEEAKLLASDGAAQDRFGGLVSVSGDVAVVGAPGDDDNGNNSGSVYVYRFDGTGWVEEAKLLASNGVAGDLFGGSVAVSGDVAVVGALSEEHFPWSGWAYVYRFDGASWVEEAQLRTKVGGDLFGDSVSISGDVAVVGAPLDDENGHWSGAAYVYRFDGESWVEETKVLASGGEVDVLFGGSVSVSGDVFMVGAITGEGEQGEITGSAYVYRFDGTSWVEHAKLLASDRPRDDNSGGRVSISGNVGVVGATWYDNGEITGSAYVFSPLSATPACADGRDNDGDRLADLDDPGCSVALDTSEHSGALLCDDGLDNDDDGLIDFPEDPGCRDPWCFREDPPCQDGIDNDGDGLIDYPDDPGCGDASDSSEKSPLLVCDDGLDNDDDRLIDYPFDLGCGDVNDSSENSPLLICDDGIDNDGDGLIDYPADPGCSDVSDSSENSPRFVCDDGVDNDSDGFIDYPADPGCRGATSSIEDPRCQDGIDNDGDGLIDFDGGLSVLGYAATDPDPECGGEAWWNNENACGLGWELGPVLAGLMLLARRRRRGGGPQLADSEVERSDHHVRRRS